MSINYSNITDCNSFFYYLFFFFFFFFKLPKVYKLVISIYESIKTGYKSGLTFMNLTITSYESVIIITFTFLFHVVISLFQARICYNKLYSRCYRL